MKAVVIVPTYNESGNIVPLIQALELQARTLAFELHILVVDDLSPDGTPELVKALQAQIPHLHLLQGRKRGLGAAYVRGIRHALEHLAPDVVLQMDADFSHAPEDMPRLLEAIVNGADFAIGSRYVPGGSIPSQWKRWRKLCSACGNIAARQIVGLRGIRDCTAGFRAIRASLLRRIDFSRLRVQGYAFQVALLHEAMAHGAIVVEIPVHFVDRTQGESKLGLRDIIEFVLNAWWIRFRSASTFLKFAIVGMSGVVVNLGCFTLFMATGLNKFLASPLAIEISIVTNFVLNNFWTFRRRSTWDGWPVKGLKFNLVSLLALGLSFASFVLLSTAAPRLAPEWVQLISIVPASLVNYFLNSAWTFRPRPGDTRASEAPNPWQR